MLLEPDAERTWLGVTAREKMSVGCADGRVCVCRYCFDCRLHQLWPQRGECEVILTIAPLIDHAQA